MYFNVAQLLKEPVGSTRIYGIDELEPNGYGTIHVAPHSQVSLMRTDEGILVRAGLEVRMWLACSRCLTRFRNPHEIVIEEEYLPIVDVNTGQPLRRRDMADGSFTIDQQHVLDLSEAVRQYSIASQPMKPVCHEGCRGLCPGCGVDKNSNSCTCEDETVDPRWTALSRLLKADGR